MLARAVVAFLALPGLFAGVLPWALALVDPWRSHGTRAGAAILAIGLTGLLWCVRDFYVAGRGTLAPWAPPRRLVAVGLYRFARNPMYLSVLMIVAGSGFLAGSPLVAMYAIVLAIAFHLRTVIYEEPWLAQQFRSEWERYRLAVPRWLPRLSPWQG